jgi:hypothetical protein
MGTVRRHPCRLAPFLIVLVLLTLAAASVACRKKEAPRPIVVADNVVTVFNASSEEWRGVEVWLNYHYRVTTPAMPAGQRLGIPLNVFVAGFGQRFDVRREIVKTIQVKARAASGVLVDVMYGSGPRR